MLLRLLAAILDCIPGHGIILGMIPELFPASGRDRYHLLDSEIILVLYCNNSYIRSHSVPNSFIWSRHYPELCLSPPCKVKGMPFNWNWAIARVKIRGTWMPTPLQILVINILGSAKLVDWENLSWEHSWGLAWGGPCVVDAGMLHRALTSNSQLHVSSCPDVLNRQYGASLWISYVSWQL